MKKHIKEIFACAKWKNYLFAYRSRIGKWSQSVIFFLERCCSVIKQKNKKNRWKLFTHLPSCIPKVQVDWLSNALVLHLLSYHHHHHPNQLHYHHPHHHHHHNQPALERDSCQSTRERNLVETRSVWSISVNTSFLSKCFWKSSTQETSIGKEQPQWKIHILFSCPGQFNRWHCHWLIKWHTFWFSNHYDHYDRYNHYI